MIPSSIGPPLPVSTTSAVPIQPWILVTVNAWLAVLFMCLFALLFLYVFAQLWLNLLGGNKRFSYQSCFLFLSLIYAALRCWLFSFFLDGLCPVELAEQLPLLFVFLYSFPPALLYALLCLLTVYFAFVCYSSLSSCFLFL